MTKEKRMRMKKENRRLRKKDKRRRILKKKITPKFHSIPIVNNETYGCEVSNDFLSTNQKKILEKIGLGNIISVKRRYKGLTSSGTCGECHSNVRKLVKLFGGKQLVGYGVQINVGYKGERCVQFYNHSVWITPEGQVIDPTKRVSSHKYNVTNFIPVVVYQEDNVWTHLMDLMFPEDFEDKGYILQGDENNPYDKRLPFDRLCWKTTIGTGKLTDEQLNSVFNQRGGFSLPSLSTGKTYDELVQEQILSNIVFMDKKMLNFLYK